MVFVKVLLLTASAQAIRVQGMEDLLVGLGATQQNEDGTEA